MRTNIFAVLKDVTSHINMQRGDVLGLRTSIMCSTGMNAFCVS